MSNLENVNVLDTCVLPAPDDIKSNLPVSQDAIEFICESRKTLESILSGTDPRKFIVVGPCSIHNVVEAKEYAVKFKQLAEEVKQQLFLIMRVYFEKPRTTVGWKGLVNDPDLDGSFQIEKGIRVARNFLLELAEMQVPAGTETLDPIIPQYLADLISWTAIGARTSESQTHREMASGLSCPVGFKNGTDGSFGVMINALKSSAYPHHFLGINQQGKVSTIATKGNFFGHCILRGGAKPNYDPVSISSLESILEINNLSQNIVVDCSHANSLKDYRLQPRVLEDCLSQIREGNSSIIGFMIESNLEEGNQAIADNVANLNKGVSVTDACVDWKTTEEMVRHAARMLK